MKANIDTVLEALGNESRRRILSLLSKKPCYVSEISYSLKMAPKAVLEHLEKLEKAGIVASFEEGRRRYYYINRNLRIEISITPHRFETVITTGNSSADIEKTVSEVKRLFEGFSFEGKSMSEFCKVLRKIEEVQQNFSRIQGMITSRITEVFEYLLDEIERHIDDEVERVVLLGLTKGANSALEIAEQFGIPYREVESALERLRKKGLVEEVQQNGRSMWVVK
ncbi:metalloregulator ArsR/SmtB family transcription factor [Archaeoglobus veneficus]|uniref:Transcriptional regulator, TrmB n=1 Tax=Archaeoglobus veneficus (strain DSM 11195 / SNP6) TaxID=693661 RepID=F2KRJ8_ARCVS|nr:metalloregulator ArsR/SmtB family transcription factor [Archaeoglobus veneficus]AEA46763.1 transcriptional regulator, TrmB [Archaeoglobus veneficus SNP6]